MCTYNGLDRGRGEVDDWGRWHSYVFSFFEMILSLSYCMWDVLLGWCIESYWKDGGGESGGVSWESILKIRFKKNKNKNVYEEKKENSFNLQITQIMNDKDLPYFMLLIFDYLYTTLS